MKVAFIGGGNFGTAMANIVATNGHLTHLWMRDAEQVSEVLKHRENRRYLPGHHLVDTLIPTADLESAVKDARVIFMTIPSASFRVVSEDLAPLIADDTYIVSATKGIEAASFKLMSQILEEIAPTQQIGVVSGPNLAQEIADGHYTGTVVASLNPDLCNCVQELFSNETFRVYANSDVYGVELGGALKNTYAIVCGMAAAINVGMNTIGMLLTRSLAEMSRFAVALGADPFTFLGLAGVGDLVVTCTSPLSRNYQLGYRLGQGMNLDEALDSMGKLAEGVNTVSVVHAKAAELGVEMPYVENLYQILFAGADLKSVIIHLMSREQGLDVEFALPKN